MSDALSQTDVALVVDDSPDTLGMLNEALEAAGISVLLALDGSQALKICQRMAPDIILLDAVMPQMDGFETCRRLKADGALADIPVIFMTGLSDTADIVQGLQAGGVDYLTKPVDPGELVARLRVHLGNARRAQSVREALDRTGQHLISLNRGGELLWATQEAQALLASSGLDTQQQCEQVFAPLSSWLTHQPQRGQKLLLQRLSAPLEAQLLSDADEVEAMFRLSDPACKPDARSLQQALPLTRRESEVLFWIANGKTNREIGEILGMSPRTVNKHLQTIFPKLGVENRTAAAAIALKLLD